MSQHDKYLTFPIAFLQLGKALDDVTTNEAKQRASNIIDWCVWKMLHFQAGKRYEENGDTTVEAIAGRHDAYHEKLGIDSRSLLAAQVTLGINLTQSTDWKPLKIRATNLESATSLKDGSKLSRVRRDIVFQAMDGGMKWRDFAVLVAIYAGCFDPKKRKAVPLTLAQIGAMSLGYKSAKCVHANAAEGFSLSDKAIGRTVEKLRKRGFFVKGSPDNGRTTYYSNSMNEEQMISYVTEVKSSRIKKRKACRSMSEIQREINARANTLSGLTPEQRLTLEGLNARLKERRRNSAQG